ncbi:cation:proton antiporter [Halosimplex amylolyticum]|uniref:cation:proton antiporter n=1 Tax=Halosimplex amylolyticum TaxID=3396616 RepID=UPI003F57E29A
MVQAGIDVALLADVLSVFIIAAGVGIFVAKIGRFPYTIALLLAGFAASVAGIHVVIDLSHDLILLVLLPPLLFEGAATTDLVRLRRNFTPIIVLAVVGLILSVLALGFVGQYAFGFDLLVALLFAAMILPTDPVSVLALFEELGAPERLSVLVEGESLINDGVGVVLFTALLARISAENGGGGHGGGGPELFSVAGAVDVGLNIAVTAGGGALVGIVGGYAVYRVMSGLDEHMTEIVLTIILAYGVFLVSEHYVEVLLGIHFSGVIATVAAGLLIGNRGAEFAMSPRTKLSVFNTWETGAFIVNTFIFVMIGVTTPVSDLLANWQFIAVAIPLVLAARALVVYPLTWLVNRFDEPTVPVAYQHVMVWGGLHASIPIALVLGLGSGSGLSPELRTTLRAMVFGVAAFSLVVQGLTMSNLLNGLGIVTRSDDEELYELLVGRARAVDEALESAEELRDSGELPAEVYEDFTAEYEREKEQLNDAIAELLREHPELRREQLLAGERQVLQREKSAISDAVRNGVISGDVGERLVEETDLKLDYVRDGRSTVEQREEGFEEFWQRRAREFGLEAVDEPASDRGEGERALDRTDRGSDQES